MYLRSENQTGMVLTASLLASGALSTVAHHQQVWGEEKAARGAHTRGGSVPREACPLSLLVQGPQMPDLHLQVGRLAHHPAQLLARHTAVLLSCNE